MDANQNVYTGKLAQALGSPPFDMTCMFQELNGCEAPPSFHRGRTPITAIFGSPGLYTEHAMAFPHFMSVGDHRLFVVDIPAATMFGGVHPRIASPKARQLNCSIDRTRRQYNRLLTSMAEEHRMQDRLVGMIQSSDEDAERLHLRHNAWDAELGCYMRAAEKQCTRRRNDMIEFSPMVNTVLHRKRIYQWALRKKKGHRINIGSLKRVANVWKVDDPLNLSIQELESRLHGLEEELNVLRYTSKQLRRQHLLECLRRAREDGDEDDEREIKRIMKRESDKEKQKRINFAVRPPQGRSVTQVQLNDPKTTPKTEADFRTEEEDIIRECNARLSQRFSLGKRAAISHGKLLEDLGNLGDTEAARRILDGTYMSSPRMQTRPQYFYSRSWRGWH
eukprot:scaffold10329_cov66-Cyclotella_meneghiniana.AAC.6